MAHSYLDNASSQRFARHWLKQEGGGDIGEREGMAKLFVERRFLAFHSYCTLYLLYLFSCNTRHRLKPQQEACSDHVLHQLQQKYVFNLGF